MEEGVQSCEVEARDGQWNDLMVNLRPQEQQSGNPDASELPSVSQPPL